MARATIGLPAKADNLRGFNDVIDTLHNFFDMIQVLDVFSWWLSLVDLLAGIRALVAP